MLNGFVNLNVSSYRVSLTYPSEINANFLAEVLSDVVEGLILVPVTPAGPVLV
jgi:hypothetical protein